MIVLVADGRSCPCRSFRRMTTSSKPLRPFSKSPHTVSPSPTDSEPSNVLTRLHALFNHSQASQDGLPKSASGESGTSPVDIDQAILRENANPTPPLTERQAIKVRIVTWNMGDALVRLFMSSSGSSALPS